MKTRLTTLWSACLVLSLLASATAHGASVFFRELDLLPVPAFPTLVALSDDGSTVIASFAGIIGRWTPQGGMQEINDLGSGFFADGISGDGSVAVGRVPGDAARLFLDAPILLQVLDEPAPPPGAGGTISSRGVDASWDGSVVVGRVQFGSDYRAFRWRDGTSQIITDRKTTDFPVVSNDGSVVAVVAGLEEPHSLVRWTANEGATYYDVLPETGYVNDISGDGSTIVGEANTGAGATSAPFRWTATSGYEEFSGLPSGSADAVSEDGSVIAGYSYPLGPYLWDSVNGVRSVSDVLVDGGVDLTDWQLGGTPFMSDDGKTLVGRGVNPDGNPAIWMAQLPDREIVWQPAPPVTLWGFEENWEPETIPDGNDTAVFRGDNYSYITEFAVDAAVGCLLVEGTGALTLSGISGNLSATQLIMGTALGDDASLVVDSVSLRVVQAKLGNARGATSQLFVTGTSPSEFLADTLLVGAQERAEVTVDGEFARLEADRVLIAQSFGNDSTVTVRHGAQMTINEQLIVGNGVPGSLVLEQGAKLQIMSDVTINTGMMIANGSRVNVSGDNTAVSSFDADLRISDSTLDIRNEAAADFRSAELQERAKVIVDAQSALTFANELRLEGFPDATSNQVEVRGESQLSVGENLILDRAEETGSTRLVVGGGSSLTANDITMGAAAAAAGGRRSVLQITGDATTANISGNIVIDDRQGVGGRSYLRVDSDATVVVTGASTKVNAGGQLELVGEETTWEQLNGDLTVDKGVVTLLNESHLMIDNVTVLGGSGLSDAGQILIDDSLLTVDGRVDVGSESTVGRIHLTNGTLLANTVVFINENSQVTGTGLVQGGAQGVRGPGFISPGLSPGTLTIEGDLALEAGGVLEIEFAGLTPGAEHDVLVVTGDTTIEGQVLLKFIDGFAPSQGEQFEFLVTGGATDLSTAQFEVLNLEPSFQFDIMPSAGGLQMVALNDGTFVPEPSSATLAIILCGFAFVGIRRRRSS